VNDRLAELHPLLGVAEPKLEGALSHAHGARGGLDAGGSKVSINCLKPWTLHPAEQRVGGQAEAVEGDFRIPSCRDSRSTSIRRLTCHWRETDRPSDPRGFSARKHRQAL